MISFVHRSFFFCVYVQARFADDLQAPRNRLPASHYVTKSPAFCLHALHFDLRLLFLFFVYLLWPGTNRKSIYISI